MRRLIYWLSLFILAGALWAGCGDNSSAAVPTNRWFDSTSFPAQPFDRVVLVSIDPLQSIAAATDSGAFMDLSQVNFVGETGYPMKQVGCVTSTITRIS